MAGAAGLCAAVVDKGGHMLSVGEVDMRKHSLLSPGMSEAPEVKVRISRTPRSIVGCTTDA